MQSGLRAAFAWLCVAAAPVAAADLDTVAADPGWAALLHVSDGQPMVRDPAFLLSLPQFSPRAELQATVALLQGPDAQSLCRFPARYLWLHRQGVLPERSLAHCADLTEFNARAPMDEVALVFASETLSQPSSMMGHVFLKLSGNDAAGQAREHAISFFTEPVTWNLPRLFWRSLVAGMPGYFTLGPYAEQVQGYIGREGRSLWEHPLRLDAAQRRLLQAHLMELRPVQFTYYFQRYNCATLVKQVLAVARPEVLSTPDLWTTPKDVVRAAQAAGMLEPARALSAPRWTLHLLDPALSADDVARVQQAVAAQDLPPAAPQDPRGFLRQQAALALNQQWVSNGQRAPEVGAAYQRRLQAAAQDDLTLTSSPALSPSAAPPDAQISVGLLRRDGDEALLLEFLPASHRLEDRNDMYFNESALRLFELALTQSLRGRGARVERATVYAVESLLPRDRFSGGLSGRFKIGHEPQAGGDLRSRGSLLVEGGLGLTQRLGRDVDVFAMATAGVGARSGAYLYAQPSVGFVLRQVFAMKAVVSFSLLHNGLGDGRTVREWQWTQAKYIGRHWTLVGGYTLRQQGELSRREAQLRLKRLF
ncbi:DUF4105 domain-containing protein [Pelomonas sp. UHG3]|uniref:DUF4105 domain-containing protein n=1 Tax=Roseateles hydrophilus TaxID=2975054 RepID=A0ACC6CBP3_9BURK|nr:DUF4105 domain-containing protein [Pelomonas sp. UHG3]MCY4745802.1 DUF4105 domain-containing protein [Pelomonas sp. UHG3]